MRGRELMRLSIGIVTGRLGAMLFQAGTLALLARSLELKEFAIVSGSLGLLAFAGALSDFGCCAAATRAIARHETDLLANLNRLNQWSALGGGILFTGALVGAWLYIGRELSPLILLGAWLIADRLAEFKLASLVGSFSSGKVAMNVLVRRLVPFVGVLVVFLADLEDFVLITFVILSPVAAVLATFMWPSPVPMPSVDKAWLRRTLRASTPFWINTLSAQSRQLDVLVAGIGGGASVAAVYAPVSRLVTPMRMLPTAFAQATLAVIAREPGRVRVSRLLLGSAAASLALFGTVSLFAEQTITFVFGSRYAGSAPAFQVLLAGLVFAALASMLTSLLQARGQERAVGRVGAFNAAATLTLILLGSAQFGGLGAAAGLSAGYVAQAFTLGLAYRKVSVEVAISDLEELGSSGPRQKPTQSEL